MDRREDTVYYLLGIVAIIFVFTVLYDVGMSALEGRPRTFLHSLQVVVETFTTTGFGSDAPWDTPLMNLFVILMDVTGVVLIFLALPVLLFPLFEDRLKTTAPTEVSGLKEHVILAGYSARGEALVEELRTRDRPYVVTEPDRERAKELYEDGLEVVHADPERERGLRAAGIEGADAVVADMDDETNASIALTARALEDVTVVTFVEDSDVARYHELAGAEETFRPSELIGDALAEKVTAGVTPDLEDAVVLDGDFDIVELPVQAGSELAGVTVRDSGIAERTGTNLVGAWFRGEFVTPPPPDARIDEQTILVAAGREADLERLKQLTLSEERRSGGGGPVVVCGYGEVGSRIVDHLERDGVSPTVVDLREEDRVDVVGDIGEESTLREAGIEHAGTVILAVSDDTSEVFATLVCREMNADIEIIARADGTESVRKLYGAGADYVLAVATVAGRLLASSLLEEDVISFDRAVELVRLDCGPLAGRTLADADVRARTGVNVVAVERAGEVLTDIGGEFKLHDGDDLVVVGTDEDVNRLAAMVEE